MHHKPGRQEGGNGGLKALTATNKGRRALILGGSCELALTLAQSMIRTSLYPILTYRNNAGKDRIDQRLLPFADSYESRFLKLGDRESLDILFRDIEDNLDFLVDFANDDYESLVAAADDDRVDRYFHENLSFRAQVLKRAARAMLKKRRGRLIYVSSTAADRPNPGQGFYGACKLASEALYRSIGLELAKRGITSAIVRPGYVDAGRGIKYLSEKGDQLLEKIPTKRMIDCNEVVGTILFLTSEEARSINGTVVTIDGGLMSCK